MSTKESRALAQAVLNAVHRIIPQYFESYSAVVTGVESGGIKFRRVSESTAGDEVYARLHMQNILVGDEVAVVSVAKHPFVLGKVKRADDDEPTISVNANAGTGATAELVAGSTDLSGEIRVSTGTSTSAGALFTFNFANAKPDLNYSVVLTNRTNAAADLQGRYNVTAVSENGWNLNLRVAPTASASYYWSYHIHPFQW